MHLLAAHNACNFLAAGDVIQLKADPGKTFSIAELKAAVAQHKPAILFLVQGESSTGTHQALGDGLGEACKAAGTLLVVDTVSSVAAAGRFLTSTCYAQAHTSSCNCSSWHQQRTPLLASCCPRISPTAAPAKPVWHWVACLCNQQHPALTCRRCCCCYHVAGGVPGWCAAVC
jgi:hypothetical protein